MRTTLLVSAAAMLTPTLATQAPTKELAQAAAAYAAKVTASALFVSDRTLESVLEQEFAPTRPMDALIRPLLRFDIDREGRSVTCRLGVGQATAVYHPGLGCSLVRGAMDANRRRYATPLPKFEVAATDQDQPWPRGDGPAPSAPAGVDAGALRASLELAFAEPERAKRIFTRAVVIARRGVLVAERYANGCNKDMPLPGWSMTKSLTNALIGVHVGAGLFDVEGRPLVTASMREEGDVRGGILNRHLLAMSAGLQWSEDYTDPGSDALRMLLSSRSHADEYTARRAAAAPGTRYQYASGATNLLCQGLRDLYRDDLEYWQMPARFFQRVGMHSAILETDPSGTFVGSSYGFASARDWARLGLLFLQDGIMFGERVLPAGWVARSTSATASPASGGRYGWQLWLNRDPDGSGPARRRWPDLPDDLFFMSGHEGQYVVVSPAAQLVIVRLGCTKGGDFPLSRFLRAVHDACS